MNANIRCLIRACKELGAACKQLHPTQNLVLVEDRHLFVNWAVPLISHSAARLMLDKDYTWHLLREVVAMPETRAYLCPHIESRFQKYVQFSSIREITADIESRFAYPLIAKRNSGSHGSHVYRCTNLKDVEEALGLIFDEHDKDWDYLALAQPYIQPAAEYRLVTLNGRIAFAYRKDTSEARFTGNLSPLHWDGARAVLVDDQQRLTRLQQFIAPLFAFVPAAFCGIDVIEDESGQLWLIELNGSPSFEIFVRDNGEELVVEFYKRVVERLRGQAG